MIARGADHYNSKKDSCPRGHPYSGDNLYVIPSGGRGCRECRREDQRRWRAAHPDRYRRQSRADAARRYAKHGEQIRLSNRLRKVGLTIGEYEAIKARQDGRCAICRMAMSAAGEHIDHCHTTGTVRGLLCARCNLALGHVKDDPAILKNMIRYLEG